MSHPVGLLEKTTFSLCPTQWDILKESYFQGITSCHPPVTLVTLQNRVQALCLSWFCHPDTLKHENPIQRMGALFKPDT